MKNFNNSLLNIVSPPPAAMTSNNKNNFCLLPNLPVPSAASGSLLPSNTIDSLSVSSAAATNSVGSILLGNTSSTQNTSTVAAMVAAFNNKGMHRQPSATVVSSSQLMVAHSNGVSDGGGGALLLGGGHPHQRLPLNPSTYAAQQSSTHHMTTANAIAVAIAAAAAAATAAQQQQQQYPYRQQHHHYQPSTASAAPSMATAFLPMNAFRSKKALASKMQTTVAESVVSSAAKQSPAAVRSCTVTTVEACTTAATSSIPSAYVPAGDGGTDTTVCTLAATVGATSAIATLASPVPSVMLLSTSSTSSSSNSNNSYNDTIGMANHSHRATADGLSPSSSSSTLVSGGFISSTSTGLMPMISTTQSNAPYISKRGSSDDGELPHSSFTQDDELATGTGADRSEEIVAAPPTFVEEESSAASIPSGTIPDVCTKHDDEGASVITTRIYPGRPLLKHKLTFNDDEHDPSSTTTKPAKVRLTAHDAETTVETYGANVSAAPAVGDSGVRVERQDDAVACNSGSFTTNGAGDGPSPPTEDSPTERCNNIRM